MVAERAVGRYASECDDATRREAVIRQGIDQAAAALVMEYGAACLLERAAVRAAETEAEERKARLLEEVESRRRVLLFGAHLDRETRSAASVKRLDAADPQRRRCARAAKDNVKRTFFAKTWANAALQVIDVYKIENRPLLDDFLKSTAEKSA